MTLTNEQIVELIKNGEKKSKSIVILRLSDDIVFDNVFTIGELNKIVIGDAKSILKVVFKNLEKIINYEIINITRNSTIELLDYSLHNCRIEPGAIIRNHVTLEDGSIIMMGAVINIGASIGRNTMIDMNAVVGAKASIGANCHIGAGSVIAGVLEPPSAKPVIIEDNVVIGANCVILEGITVGKNSIVGAGSIVTKDVEENSVVYGNPARFIKFKDENIKEKTKIVDELRIL